MKCLFKLLNFKTLGDERGSLIAIEKNYNAPFEIKRIYYIFDTRENITRGYHAHRNLKQIAIAIQGECTFVLDDGTKRTDVKLSDPKEGLLIEGLIWREMKNFSSDCVLLVLASENYDENDYIRDYQDFKKEFYNEER